MPACPGTSPESSSTGPALRLVASDGGPVLSPRAGPDRPLGEIPAPATVPGQMRIQPGAANIARVYDALLGGKDNYEADRKAAEQVMRLRPQAVASARANRAYLGRVVRYLAAARGIRQFLDIGPGLPTPVNTHGIAQGIHPEARVVYVDSDPVVLCHARALLTSGPQGSCGYVQADLRDPSSILAQAARTLDFTQPVAVLLLAVLHFLAEDEYPARVVATLAGGLAPGSYLALSHLTADMAPEQVGAAAAAYNALAPVPVTPRTHSQVTALLGGLPLVSPGVVLVTEWRPETWAAARACDLFAGVAVIPRGHRVTSRRAAAGPGCRSPWRDAARPAGPAPSG